MLNFYNYDECLKFYSNRIRQLNQNKMYGKVNIAKPVLLLAVIQLIDKRWLLDNRIILTSEIENRYKDLYHQYDRTKDATPVYYPPEFNSSASKKQRVTLIP